MSLKLPRPIAPRFASHCHRQLPHRHTGHPGTARARHARCLRWTTGALIYGASRIGKTRAIEYVRLLLAETHPKITTYHAQAEHKPRHAEGPFFSNLLEAVGYPDP